MKPQPKRTRNRHPVREPQKLTRQEYQQARRLTEGLGQLWSCDDPCDRRPAVLDSDGLR